MKVSVIASVLLVAAQAHAQAPAGLGDLEVTMRLLPERAARPDEVTRTIILPSAAAPVAVESSQHGLDRANTVHESGTERANERGAGAIGGDHAAEARERGRDFGQEVQDQARENRENAERGSEEPDRPEQPEQPSRPDLPNGAGRAS